MLTSIRTQMEFHKDLTLFCSNLLLLHLNVLNQTLLMSLLKKFLYKHWTV